MKKAFLGLMLMAQPCFAWRDRGHHLICEAAAHLVRNEELRNFLSERGDLLGHVCNLPDTDWRGQGRAAHEGDRTHFMDPEKINMHIEDIPTSLDALEKKTGEKRTELLKKMGSLWWRADQFTRLGVATATAASKATDSTKDIFAMLVDMGLLGHFIGDASMPYHNSADYDGKKSGHPGIHAFYESDCVNRYPLTLLPEVATLADEALKKSSEKDFSVLERIKELSVRSRAEIPLIEKIDHRETPLKAHASCDGFKELIEGDLAASTALLAQTWDFIFTQGDRPSLKHYKSFRYPLTVDFVPADYEK